MAVNLELRGDFDVFDFHEHVSYTAVFPTPDVSFSGVRVVRRPLTESTGRRIEQFVTLMVGDIVFLVDSESGSNGSSESLVEYAEAPNFVGAGDDIMDELGRHYTCVYLEMKSRTRRFKSGLPSEELVFPHGGQIWLFVGRPV